jgi:hypothetical protein
MASEDRPPRRPAPSANRQPFTPRPTPGASEEETPAPRERQQRPSREHEPRQERDQQTSPRAAVELPKVDFDPTRVKLPQIAIVGFLIGIFFHACVAFAILDDSGGGGGSNASTSNGGTTVEQQETMTPPTAVPTIDPKADRKDCNAIRADPNYRSDAERQWFLANCTVR